MITPLEKKTELGKMIGGHEDLYFKHEEIHPYRSHKGRSIPLMIDIYIKEGFTEFAISSSGNAALAAGLHIVKLNAENPDRPITLKMFIGNKIEPGKRDMLKKLFIDPKIILTQVDRPMQAAFEEGKKSGVKVLRQSTDDVALLGYSALAEELSQNLTRISAIFIPTSSGTAAQAIGKAFRDLKLSPQIHIVQTSQVHPIASHFDDDVMPQEISRANAIVDIIGHRKDTVIETVKQSGGFGWKITNEKLEQATILTREKTGIILSPNSALAVAGMQKAVERGWHWEGAVVCLITGA